MTLRNKLILVSVILLVFPMAVSTGVVSTILTQQNRNATHDLLKKSIDVIRDDLSVQQEKLFSNASQLASINAMGSRMKFLYEQKRSKASLDVSESTYKEVGNDLYQISRTSKLWNMALYDRDGALISFASQQDGELLSVGYVHHADHAVIMAASLKKGQELGADAWKKVENMPDALLKLKFDRKIPDENTVTFELIDKTTCLVSYVPVIAEEFNAKTNAAEKRKYGFAVAVLKIDEAFVKKMSSLTGMRVNIFAGDRLSSGDLPEYQKLLTVPGKQQAGKWDFAKQEISFNEIPLKDQEYFQGVLPLYGDSGSIGAIAALYSKALVKANTWQMVKLLMVVYIACMLLTIPFSIFFSNSLTKPINAAIKSLTDMADEVSNASARLLLCARACQCDFRASVFTGGDLIVPRRDVLYDKTEYGQCAEGG